MQVQRQINVAAQHDFEDGMDSKLSLMSSKAMETRYYEGCGREGPIRCIFLGEFHPVAGPKISCQFPEDYISKEVFDTISAYIIPKPLIQKCTMTINALGHKVVGYPIRIENSNYDRNMYVFNLCFVCDSWSKTVQYEPVVKKLGEHLRIMEKETKFVSSGCSKLPTLLAHLLHDLNMYRKATIVEDIYEFAMDEHILRRELRQVEAAFLQNCRAQALGICGPNYRRNITKKNAEADQEKPSPKEKHLRSRSSSRSPRRSASPLSSAPKSPSPIRSASPGFGSSSEESSDFSDEDTDRSNLPIIRDEKMPTDDNETESNDPEKPVFRSL